MEIIKKRISLATKWKIKRALGVHPTMKLFYHLQGLYGMLSPIDKKECDDYAKNVLGSSAHAPWLYIYSLLSGGFKTGWISDSYYGSKVIPSMSGDYGQVSELKAYQTRLFGEIIPDVLYLINGKFWDTEGDFISDQGAIKILPAWPERLVFKTDRSSQGKGVSVLTTNELDESTLKILPNGVFQRYVEQHPDLALFHPGSVSTLRITTVIDLNGEASVRGCYLRFGSGTDLHVKSASQIKVPVDMITGKLGEIGYSADWLQMDRHPDSGESFAGMQIPAFDRCLKTAKRLHKRVPFIQCIGWDLTIDEHSQPFLLEWNGIHNDIKFTEIVQGPAFVDLGWENLWRRPWQ